jgi:PAS domain S-box-containing protein
MSNSRDYAIFSTGLDRRVTSWNVGAKAMLGHTEAEILGKVADDIFAPEHREAGVPEVEAQTALAEGRHQIRTEATAHGVQIVTAAQWALDLFLGRCSN